MFNKLNLWLWVTYRREMLVFDPSSSGTVPVWDKLMTGYWGIISLTPSQRYIIMTSPAISWFLCFPDVCVINSLNPHYCKDVKHNGYSCVMASKIKWRKRCFCCFFWSFLLTLAILLSAQGGILWPVFIRRALLVNMFTPIWLIEFWPNLTGMTLNGPLPKVFKRFRLVA